MALLRQVIDVYVFTSVVFMAVATGVSSLPPLSCSVETVTGAKLQCGTSISYKEDCTLDNEELDKRSSSSTSSSSSSRMEEEEEEEEDSILVREKPLDSANSFTDINFPLWHTKRAAVVVAGRQARGRRQRCAVVLVVVSGSGRVTIHDLALPHGSYQVKVVTRRKEEEEGGGGRGGGGRKARVKVLRHLFVLVKNQRQNRAHSRQRRHKDTLPAHTTSQSPIQEVMLPIIRQKKEEEEEQEGHASSTYSGGDIGGGGGGDCLCCNCFDFGLVYDNSTAVLTFSYQLYHGCNASCAAVNVQLYRNNESQSAAQCLKDKLHLILAQRIGLDRNVTESPVIYSGIDNGCYFVELKPQLYRLPERTRSLWAHPNITVPNMNDWTTVFSLEPNPKRKSLTVRWTESDPYNFSSYRLILQHHPDIPINCTGEAIYQNISIIPHGHLTVTQPMYVFYNLSVGWYCARVTPWDSRCPLDGCDVLSSPAQKLTEALQWQCEDGTSGEDCEGRSVLGLTLLVVGCVVGAVVTGVMVAWGILHAWPSLSHVFTSATQYSAVPIRPAVKTAAGRKQIVLLVWTPQGRDGAKYRPIISAFKTILRTYSHCEVYDYLDLPSLPERQQMHLLASPTTWLDSILAQRSIKVIIVATEGAWQRQMEWKEASPCVRRDTPILSAPLHAHDRMLFPYLLRRLHDQPDLAGDYSRVFHVRFSEVSHSGVELDNIVSWKRYKIPEHLHSLTVSLHGVCLCVCHHQDKVSYRIHQGLQHKPT